jgi:cysteinyl-tRNA synthetase
MTEIYYHNTDIYYHSTEIYYIEKMIRYNKAYVLNIDKIGQFVCGSYDQIKPKCNPIPNESVSEYRHKENDFVLWFPATDGLDSPWGKGYPSANLYVLCMYN